VSLSVVIVDESHDHAPDFYSQGSGQPGTQEDLGGDYISLEVVDKDWYVATTICFEYWILVWSRWEQGFGLGGRSAHYSWGSVSGLKTITDDSP
jgi:hypothetical protein